MDEFKLGNIYESKGVRELAIENEEFANHLMISLDKYRNQIIENVKTVMEICEEYLCQSYYGDNVRQEVIAKISKLPSYISDASFPEYVHENTFHWTLYMVTTTIINLFTGYEKTRTNIFFGHELLEVKF